MRLALIVLFLAGLASAQANLRITPGERSNRNAEYRQVVANYCRFDFDGTRLSPEGWNRIKLLTSWRDNPDFRRVVVVNRYEVLPDVTSEHGRAIFTVQYDVSGEYDLVGGYFPGPTRATVQIEAGEFNGEARVVTLSEQHPFVGRTRFEQWLTAKIASETDAGVKATLQSSLERLQAQTKKPVSGQ